MQDYTKILRRGNNPVVVNEDYIVMLTKEESIQWFGRQQRTMDLDDGLYDEQDESFRTADGKILPSWLMDGDQLPLPPQPRRLTKAVLTPEYIPTPLHLIQSGEGIRSIVQSGCTRPKLLQPVITPGDLTQSAKESVTLHVPSPFSYVGQKLPQPASRPLSSQIVPPTVLDTPPCTLATTPSMPSNHVVLADLMLSSNDKEDPLLNENDGIQFSLFDALASTPVHPSSKTVKTMSPRKTSSTEIARQSKETQTEKEESKLDEILTYMKRISQTMDEQLKVYVQHSRAVQTTLEEVQRIERKVTNIYRRMEDTDKGMQPPLKKSRTEKENRQTQSTKDTGIRSVVKRVN